MQMILELLKLFIVVLEINFNSLTLASLEEVLEKRRLLYESQCKFCSTLMRMASLLAYF